MTRQRSIALISVVDPADAADSIATALHGRAAAHRFVAQVLDRLGPASPEPRLFGDES